MSEFQVLDLFCGLGGFSQSFSNSNLWDVTTVDMESRFNPDFRADVFNLRPSDFTRDFDVILASPPCKQFSMAASSYNRIVDGEPQTADAKDAVALVYHSLGLIQGLNPEYWIMENPQGYLRQVIGMPTGRVTYCQYGTDWMKPTDLWGNHPAGLSYLSCSYGDKCHTSNTDQDNGGLGNCMSSGERDSAKRAKVPFKLSDAIRKACEQALRGKTVKQTKLKEIQQNAQKSLSNYE